MRNYSRVFFLHKKLFWLWSFSTTGFTWSDGYILGFYLTWNVCFFLFIEFFRLLDYLWDCFKLTSEFFGGKFSTLCTEFFPVMSYILHVWFYYFPLFRIAYAFLCVSRNVIRLYLQLFVGWFMSYLRFYLCVCLRIVVSKTYHVVFLFCFSLSCVHYIASFSGLFIFDWPFDIL